MDQQAHVLILRRVAKATIDDARAAWKKARGSPSVKNLRSAFRACILAARALRRAAAAAGIPKDESGQMLAEATRIDTTAAQLKAQLVSALEG